VHSQAVRADLASRAHGTEKILKMFCLLEFVRLEYCSTDVMNNFFNLLSKHFYDINVGEPLRFPRKLEPGSSFLRQ
jgi:hypothetical protein